MAISVANQYTNGSQDTGTTTFTITSAAANNVLVVFVASWRDSGTGAVGVSGISCTNCTFSSIATSSGQSFLQAEIWWAQVGTGGSGTTLTITYNSTGNASSANVTEFQGIGNTPTRDVIDNTNSGNSTTPATGNYSSLNQDLLLTNLLVYTVGTPSVSSNPASPWNTLNTSVLGNILSAASWQVNSNGTYSAAWVAPVSLTTPIWETNIVGLIVTITPPPSSTTQPQLMMMGVGS